jgi:hypothetical protein
VCNGKASKDNAENSKTYRDKSPKVKSSNGNASNGKAKQRDIAKVKAWYGNAVRLRSGEANECQIS